MATKNYYLIRAQAHQKYTLTRYRGPGPGDTIGPISDHAEAKAEQARLNAEVTAANRAAKKPHGGKREKAGRPTERKVDRERPVYLFADQLEKIPGDVPDFVRAAVDAAMIARRPTG